MTDLRAGTIAFAVSLISLGGAAPVFAGTAYVPGLADDAVSVVDTATNSSVGTSIPVGDAPTAIAITPDGSLAYVTNQGPDNVSVIDIATKTTIGPPIPVGGNPLAIAITPDGSRAYVVNEAGSVSVIDTATNSTVGAPIPVGPLPLGIAITPAGDRAYVTNTGPNNVSVIDTATNATVGPRIPVGSDPHGIAITPDGSRLYVANQSDSTVSVINTATNTTVGPPIGVGASTPWGIAISPGGNRAYIGGIAGSLTAINTATNTVAAGPLALGGIIFAIAFTADGSRAYVAARPNRVVVIDTATFTTTGPPITVANDPEGIAIVPNQPPVASFAASPNPAGPGQAVAFDGTGSTDFDGTVARFDWDFGDGSSATDAGPTPSHAYAAGTYEVRLTVTDGEGCPGAFVFTGQTANCNGNAATTTRALTIDGTAPDFALGGKRKLALRGRVGVSVSGVSEDASLEATGTLAATGARNGRTAFRVFTLKAARAQVPAGGGATLKLKLSRKAQRASAKALRDGGSVKANVTVTAADTAGNSASADRRVRIKQ